MSTTTTRAALVKPATSEFYDVTIFNANADKIDNLVGFTPATSTTRPSTPIAGQGVLESDTGAALVSNGSSPASASWSYLHGTGGPATLGATGAQAALRIQTTATISGNRVVDFRKSGDTNASFIQDFDGRMQWGPGGSTNVDVNLYRASAGVLKTDNTINAVTDVQVNGSSLSRGVVGGRQITGTNNLGPTITTTETEPTNMDSGSVALSSNRRYRITVRFKALGSVANDIYSLKIRVGATAGTGGNQLRENVFTILANGIGYTDEFSTDYETGSSPGSLVFTMTAVRVSGSGNIQFQGGAAGLANPVGVVVKDEGPANVLTTTAS
jgi:hypothetical protein